MTKTPLEIIRGDTTQYTITFKDSVGAPIDISGWTIFLTVKGSIFDSDDKAVIKKDITITDGSGGQAVITLLPTDTATLPPLTYLYDIQVKTNTGEVYTVLLGDFTIIGDVTVRTV